MYIAWLYLICSVLALLVCALSHYFEMNYLPPELGSLKRLWAILGAVQRLSWILLRPVHYLLYMMLAVFMINSLSMPDCAKELAPSLLFYTVLTQALWFAQHIGGMLIRSFTDISIYVHNPYDPESNRHYQILCYQLGP